MTPSRPYLLRGIYDWLIDNEQTPYLLVDAKAEGVTVPLEHVQDGKIILNISLTATRDLELTNEGVSFNARFGGKPMIVNVPIMAALALYSKENGRGMMFPEENTDDDPLSPDPTRGKDESPQKPHLTLVK
ncbi:MAG: ClpXP protease specificity-enhancing factor [gamma proteobacterium symbiont of Bathyaustriella thionipta]|nr:ClpXP protease specificity-enhancing factor [gamma proteobacterium symbiont of Bathyaustriella thionipta]MCU7948409.1 ClpXP protease specificity-enhancing factor [gamma proteobacterium symbiont of Bathyaustriella thionipta]MCU7954108.1 ClpXP protease specificity-enhancing factor [gamma proteobacterium symbiont of Bathyaustriella thionipta]MCU7955401.1 ClpXP protease specificity-enhancing factor [gamma proteobacterium symbiont of Bathyaustriella thionipta]MCU7966764.1 ClpXP protease specifici